MRYLFICYVVFLFVLNTHGQSEATSPIYTFSIKKRIEPPILDLVPGSLRFVDNDGNNAINANEACAIAFDMKNTGSGDALNLKAELKAEGSKAGVTFNPEQTLSNIPKGKTESYRIDITSGMATQDGSIEFTVEVIEPNGFNSDVMKLEVATKKFAAPIVHIVDYTIFSNDGSTNLSLRKTFALQLLLQNTGQGRANDIKYDFEVPENVFVTKGDEHAVLGSLEAGETRSLEFEMIMNTRFTGNELKITLKLSESFGKYAENWTGTFTLNQRLASEKLIVEAHPDEQGKPIVIGSLRSDVDRDIPLGLPVNNKKYALVIGNEDYSRYQSGLDKEANVDYAANDARVFAEYAERTLGVPRQNVTLLIDATKGQMSQALAVLTRLIEVENGEAEVIFYYSGHGLPEEGTNTPYLIPVDVSGTQPGLGIGLQGVYNSLSLYPAKKVTIVLDACFSGGARGKELVAMKAVKVKANVESVPANLVVLASSSGNEASAVYREKQHGYFTYFLLKQLKENKAANTFREIVEDIKQNVGREAARTGKVQTPDVLYSPLMENQWQNLTW